jgi:hypothetical protein
LRALVAQYIEADGHERGKQLVVLRSGLTGRLDVQQQPCAMPVDGWQPLITSDKQGRRTHVAGNCGLTLDRDGMPAQNC